MVKLTRSQRLAILDQINDLLMLDSLGFDVADELVECGTQLGWTDDKPTPIHLQGDITEEEFHKYLIVAKQKDIPVRVYKDRLRRGKPPKEAATIPYFKKVDQRPSEEEFVKLAARNGINSNTYRWRRRRGWSKEAAATMPLIKRNETRGKNKEQYDKG